MSGVWPWIAAVVVVGLALGIYAVRTQQHRTAVHATAVQAVLDGDCEEAMLESWLRLPDYEEKPHA